MDNIKLLVVDDDTTVRDSIASYLTTCGFDVIQAENGATALSVYNEQKPDLVLSDLNMPVMDGFNLLREIRRISKETPFIVLSGAGVINDVIKAINLGATDYIAKPIIDFLMLKYSIDRAVHNLTLEQQNRKYRYNLEEVIETLKTSIDIFRTDQKAGSQIQKKLLPITPFSYHGYKLEYNILPSLYLSGDFIDYFIIDDHNFGFYLADVSGHGASSALVTILLKNMALNLLHKYQSKPTNQQLKPSTLLGYMNEMIIKSNLDKHATLFAGIINTQNNKLSFAFGGHHPKPIIAMNNIVTFLDGQGLPIGLFPEVDFEDKELDLSENFTLAVFSDGILEALAPKTLQQKEQILLSCMHKQEISTDELMVQLGLSQLTSPPDDVAMLLVSR